MKPPVGILRMLLLLFCLLILLPTALSWGAGSKFLFLGIEIHHHKATATIGVLCVVLLLFFCFAKRVREQFLDLAVWYDGLSEKTILRFELFVLIAITVWLGFLKWMQSHFLFTHVYDHGIFVNIFWNSAHNHWYWNSFKHMNFLGDHFSPFLGVIGLPFFWGDFESWPLLAQTMAIMFAVWLVVRVVSKIHPIRPFERLLLLFLFVCNRYFQQVHRFDVHPIVFGVPVVVALYVLAKKRSWFFFLVLPIALFTVQEDVSMIVAGIALYGMVSGNQKRFWVLVLVLSLGALWINVKVLIPYFGHGETQYIARYPSMGKDFNDLVGAFIFRPWVPGKLFFSFSRLAPLFELFGSWGFLPLLSSGCVALVPAILQNSLSDYATQYTYGAHYSAGLLPFLMIGTLVSLSRRKIEYKKLVPLMLVLIAFSSFSNEQYLPPGNKERVQNVRNYAATVGKNVPVCVQGSIGIPFSFRSKVTMYPDIGEAKLIILAPWTASWPLEKEELMKQIQELRRNHHWVEEQASDLVVFRKKKGPRADLSSPWGVNTGLESEMISDTVVQLGAKWVRFPIDWFRVEKSKGVFDWRLSDAQVSRARARNLQMYVVLYGTPRWANGGKSESDPPILAEDWAHFVTAVVRRYGGTSGIRLFGMWNEPNVGKFWKGNARDYVDKILIPGARAVKSVDPALLVGGPELSHHSKNQSDWKLSKILESAESYVDLVTLHYYPDSGEDFADYLDKYARPTLGKKELWITEIGEVACSVKPGSEERQRRASVEFLNAWSSRSDWFTKIFFYRVWDPADSCQHGNGFGLTYGSAVITERPAFAAYQEFIRAGKRP